MKKLLKYVELLKKHKDPTAQPVREFCEKHQKDEVFIYRAKIMNAVYLVGQAYRTEQRWGF